MQQTSATTGLTLLFNEAVRLTGFTEYGYSLQDLLQGKPLPPEGARFDIGFEGEVSGDRICRHWPHLPTKTKLPVLLILNTSLCIAFQQDAGKEGTT